MGIVHVGHVWGRWTGLGQFNRNHWQKRTGHMRGRVRLQPTHSHQGWDRELAEPGQAASPSAEAGIWGRLE